MSVLLSCTSVSKLELSLLQNGDICTGCLERMTSIFVYLVCISHIIIIVCYSEQAPINGKPHYPRPSGIPGAFWYLKIINSNFPGVGLSLRSNPLIQLLLYSSSTQWI